MLPSVQMEQSVLNGFSAIAAVTPVGRLIDPRYFRFGVKLTF